MTRGIATLAVAGALAGCASTTAGTGSIAADVPAATGTAAPDPTGSAAPAPAPTTRAPARTVRLGIVVMPVPPGWTARVDGELLCMTAAGDDGCTLQVVDVGRIRARGGSVSTPDPAADTGWWTGSDVPNCDPSGGAYVPVTSSTRVPGPTTRPVGTKTALYGSWSVRCQDGDLDFDPRLWWLPTSRVAFLQRTTVAGSGEAVDALLRGVRFSG